MKKQIKLIIISSIVIMGGAISLLADAAQDSCVKNTPACSTDPNHYSPCTVCNMVYDCTMICGCPYAPNPTGCETAALAGGIDCLTRNQCPSKNPTPIGK